MATRPVAQWATDTYMPDRGSERVHAQKWIPQRTQGVWGVGGMLGDGYESIRRPSDAPDGGYIGYL